MPEIIIKYNGVHASDGGIGDAEFAADCARAVAVATARLTPINQFIVNAFFGWGPLTGKQFSAARIATVLQLDEQVVKAVIQAFRLDVANELL